MKVRRLGISEARQRLPALVESIARDGGRVDITWRGQSRVSIVRTGAREPDRSAQGIPSALRIQLNVSAQRLVDLLRELRSKSGRPRSLPSSGSRRRRRGRP